MSGLDLPSNDTSCCHLDTTAALEVYSGNRMLNSKHQWLALSSQRNDTNKNMFDVQEKQTAFCLDTGPVLVYLHMHNESDHFSNKQFLSNYKKISSHFYFDKGRSPSVVWRAPLNQRKIQNNLTGWKDQSNKKNFTHLDLTSFALNTELL